LTADRRPQTADRRPQGPGSGRECARAAPAPFPAARRGASRWLAASLAALLALPLLAGLSNSAQAQTAARPRMPPSL